MVPGRVQQTLFGMSDDSKTLRVRQYAEKMDSQCYQHEMLGCMLPARNRNRQRAAAAAPGALASPEPRRAIG